VRVPGETAAEANAGQDLTAYVGLPTLRDQRNVHAISAFPRTISM
jgi:hypothetical protein